MGAVTSLLHTSLYDKKKYIKGLILDSPFSSLE